VTEAAFKERARCLRLATSLVEDKRRAGHPIDIADVVDVLERARAEARREERGACAQVAIDEASGFARDGLGGYEHAARLVAARILDPRGKETP
jgi:hypothetical protein